jgi:periplasmic protein TonB
LKRYLVFSIILHILILLIAFFLIPDKREKGPKPFIARLVTPDELVREEKKEEKRIIPQKEDQQHKYNKDSRIRTFEKDVPKALSGIPTSPSAKKIPLGPRALTKELPPKGVFAKPSLDVGGEKGYTDGNSTALPGKSPVRGQPSLREKLFDREIIGKLSRKNQEGTKEGSSITFDSTEFKYYGYMQRLREKIESVWRYPPDAAALGIYGDLHIQFTIKKNGELGAVQLVRTSGYKSLDDAAIKALRDAGPYWPLDNIGNESLTITGHFIYVNGAYYIR